MSNVRTIYENTETRDAELLVASLIERRWKCKAVHMPRKSRLDFALYRERVLYAFAEVRCRNTASTDHADYMLAMQKYLDGALLSQFTARPVFLVVAFSDGIFFCNFNAARQGVELLDVRDGGMSADARGDSEDREPCVYIPMALFRRLEVPNELAESKSLRK